MTSFMTVVLWTVDNVGRSEGEKVMKETLTSFVTVMDS